MFCCWKQAGRDRHPYLHIPLGLGRMHKARMFDWGYDSEPEPALNGRRIEAMRGKVLGGSSSINVMAFTRGDPADYDRWAQNGAHGWSYADVLPYFKRCETWEEGENTCRGGQRSDWRRMGEDARSAVLRLARRGEAARVIPSSTITMPGSMRDLPAANIPSAMAGGARRQPPI